MIILLSYYPVSRDIFPVANSVFSCVASDMMITWKAHPVPGDFREKLEMEAYHSDPGFMQAMQAYKQRSGRMFPTWSEVLEVLQSLGYQKRS